MAKEELKSLLTPSFMAIIIIISALLSWISINAVMFVSYFTHFFSFGNNWWGLAPGPFLMISFVILARYFHPSLRKKIDPKRLNILWGVASVTVMMSSFRFPLCLSAWFPIRFNDPWKGVLSHLIPTYFFPDEDVLRPALEGGFPTPWSDWLPAIAFWVVYGLSMYFLALSIALIFRRLYIDIEMLPFPVAQAANEVVMLVAATGKSEEAGSETSRVRFSRPRLVLLGIGVGFLFYLPWILRMSFPWFPSIYGWEASPWIGHAGVLNLEAAIPALHYMLPMACLYAAFNPVVIGIGLFMSLDMLFSAWIAWIIFEIIIPVILANAGLYPSPGPFSSSSRYWLFGHTGPYRAVAIFDIGAMYFGLALWPIIFNWRYIVDIIKSIGKPKPDEVEREGLTYRAIFIMFILACIVLGACCVVAGTGFISVPVLIFFAILGILSVGIRVHGEAVTFMDSIQHFHSGNLYNVLFQGYTDEMVDQKYYMTMVIGHDLFGRTFVNLPGGVAAYTMDSFKLQKYTGVSMRDLIVSQSIAAVISIVVALTTMINLWYSVGILKTPGGNTAYWWLWWIIPSQMPSGAVTRPEAPYWHYSLLGFCITGAVMFLRARFPWFPLNATGLCIGATTAQAFQGIAAGYLVSWIIKYAVIKFAGAKVFDSYVIPFTGGWISGWFLAILLGTILATVKFFYPW